MKEFALGVDGGGTNTQCALFDLEGNLIDVLDWGPTNHEVLAGGFEELEESLKAMLGIFYAKHSIDAKNLVSCAFGMAGVDTKKQAKIIGDMIKRLGINRFILSNDAYLGVKAGCPSGVGICVINGTGATIAGIDVDGSMIQIGGQGGFTGDVGGGGALAVAAISKVYDHLFRDGRHTILKDMLFHRLKISSRHDFMDAVTGGLQDGSLERVDVTKMLFEAASQKDEVALEILRYVGTELGRSVNGAISELGFADIEVIDVVLAGSVNVKGSDPALVDAIKAEVLSKNPDRRIEFIILEHPPVAGAVIWALEGVYKGKGLFDKVVGQFS